LLIEACHRTDRQKQKWAIGPLSLLLHAGIVPGTDGVTLSSWGKHARAKITRAAKQNSPMRGYF
jgi:hypothetical protein